MSRLRSVVISAGTLSILSVSAAFAHPPPPFDSGWKLCFNEQNQHVAYHFDPKLDPKKEAVTFQLDSIADSFYKLNVTSTPELVEIERIPINTLIGTNAVPIDQKLWDETVGWCEKFGGGGSPTRFKRSDDYGRARERERGACARHREKDADDI
jgi:hypothetical protein